MAPPSRGIPVKEMSSHARTEQWVQSVVPETETKKNDHFGTIIILSDDEDERSAAKATEKKKEDYLKDYEGINITEPTSMNIDEVPQSDDEFDERGNKRTLRSQASRFSNLPDPSAAGDSEVVHPIKINLGTMQVKKKEEKKAKKKIISLRTLMEDENIFIMDAKSCGNLGRYLNHGCTPNSFVQNVFVDTHDPRFPWIAFFAGKYIRAGTELTWDYNYQVGSVPNKILYCHCGSADCRGRLL